MPARAAAEAGLAAPLPLKLDGLPALQLELDWLPALLL